MLLMLNVADANIGTAIASAIITADFPFGPNMEFIMIQIVPCTREEK